MLRSTQPIKVLVTSKRRMLAEDTTGANERSTRVICAIIDLAMGSMAQRRDTTDVVGTHTVAVSVELYGIDGVRVDGKRVVKTRVAYSTVVYQRWIVKVVPVKHGGPPLIGHASADGGHLTEQHIFSFFRLLASRGENVAGGNYDVGIEHDYEVHLLSGRDEVDYSVTFRGQTSIVG